jgi:hypothetical protein
MVKINYRINVCCDVDDQEKAKQIYNWLLFQLTAKKQDGIITQGQVAWSEQTEVKSKTVMV